MTYAAHLDDHQTDVFLFFTSTLCLPAIFFRLGQFFVAVSVSIPGCEFFFCCICRYNLGKVLESMDEFEAASDCMATALQVQITSPVVPFSSVPLCFE